MVALLVAAGVAALAWRSSTLSASGALAATAVGAAAIHAGAPWVVLLLVFFLSSSGLSRWRRADRAQRTDAIVAKGDARDAWQVAANGGVFALAAVVAPIGDSVAWHAVGAGAIAAAMADTWSTEIGTILGTSPRLILTGRVVPPGTSGGVTVMGTAAALCGALLAALVSCAMDWGTPFLAIAAGGLGGALADSLLGASVQERRWCDRCESATEQRIHRCGAATRRHGGIPGFENDMVNLASTAVGAVITWWLR